MTNSIFDLDEFKPYADAWNARARELARREAYWNGSVYTSALQSLAWLRPRLSGAIRPLYLPLARAVNVDAGIIPGAWRLAASAARFQPAVDRVLGWSNWAEDGVLYVHYGSLYGVSGLRVSDLRAGPRVLLSPVNPRTFMLAGGGLYDRTPALALVVERRALDAAPGVPRVPDGAESFEYAEVIEPERIRTFANGQPFGFDGRPAEYPNALGAVPFVEVKHINTGRALGDCAFDAVIPLLDQVNRLASELAEVIHRYQDPQYVITGAESGELARGGDNVWFLPQGAKVEILVAGIDIPGTLQFIRETRDQVEKGLCQLAFDEVSAAKYVAAETVRLQLLELALYVHRTRPNYDVGLIKALRLAGRAARSMTAAADRALDEVAALDSDELALDDARPVLPLEAVRLNALPIKDSDSVL